MIYQVSSYLKSNFRISNDQAEEFVGMEIKHTRVMRIIKINKFKYIDRIYHSFGMDNT